MRYRILAIPLALTAVLGLSAPAALAGTNMSPVKANHTGQTFGPFHIMTNENQSVGITYPGAGNQAIITSNPGSSYIEAVDSGSVFVIHNSNGKCLRMRGAGNGHAVIEENGCTTRDGNERFAWFQVGSGNLYEFQNVATGEWLGVSCPAKNGNKVWGVSGATGTCFNWLLK